ITSPVLLLAWRKLMRSGNGIDNGGRLVPRGMLNLIKIDPYSAMEADLVANFGRGNVLMFAYDWRLANEHNALLLQAAIPRQWPDAGSSPERRVHIISHSMGGLVSRWLIESLGGARLVQRLITVGTPHFGAPEALTTMAAASTGMLSGIAGSIPGLGRELAE